ncbi:cytochrome d ubiquinol oxidase subunit II [Streptomyces sp. KL116D]|uniref:cytochrome d ubiquinol oxidase subunit II n=1 Tax=Streptomyces sp. KL116D TaxID=3045152 RepID=UPI003558922A
MSLETAWLALLGLLLAGYFVLGGYDYGVQMLRPLLGDSDSDSDSDRDETQDAHGTHDALDAIAPFFLGNEVWLVAFAGVLFGAFPHLEGSLLPGLYPLVVAILAGLVIGNAAVQLRRRARSTRGRRIWDALIVAGGAVPAACWGLVVGLLLHGVPRRADGSFRVGAAEVFTPFVLACGATTLLLFAAHGAAFAALRAPSRQLAVRAYKLGVRLIGASGAAALLALLLTVVGSGADLTNRTASVVVAVVLAGAFGAAWWSFSAGHPVRAFASTCLATALPVLLVGAGHYPYLLISSAGRGLDVGHAVTDDATLRILSAFGVFVVPTVLAYQAWSWWAFRGRAGHRHPRYF